jgi:outer membrane protein OmpA-like peptidoglycan-associated protein
MPGIFWNFIIVLISSLMVIPSASLAQQGTPRSGVSVDDIEKALMPDLPERTRKFERGISSIEPATAQQITTKPIGMQIQFRKDSAELSDDGMKQLDSVAEGMGKVKKRSLARGITSKFVIVGHASREGDSGHNMSLSDRRAQTVKAYMIRYWDMKSDDFETVTGRGASEPIPGVDPYAEVNRRVEFSTVATRAAESK